MIWETRWETTLTEPELVEIRELLGAAFPDYPGGVHRGWLGERPELRILGLEDGRLIAHAGVLRRHLRVRTTGVSFLVGDVGMVAVHPTEQSRGVGAALMRRVAVTLASLGVEHGCLCTSDDRAGFYLGVGWLRAPQIMHGISLCNQSRPCTGPVMFYPVSGVAWPTGELERNGREI